MSDCFFIATIVEGHGEYYAVPVLLRRLIAEFAPASRLELNPPLRVKAGSFLKDRLYFEKYVELAARKVKAWPKSCVLILLDSEDACPAQLGPELFQRASNCRSDVTFIVTLAHREYETWFLAAAKSLRGVGGLPLDLELPANPESLRDAKGWLSGKMKARYNEPGHQPTFTAAFSLDEARAVDSFERIFQKLRAFFT